MRPDRVCLLFHGRWFCFRRCPTYFMQWDLISYTIGHLLVSRPFETVCRILYHWLNEHACWNNYRYSSSSWSSFLKFILEARDFGKSVQRVYNYVIIITWFLENVELSSVYWNYSNFDSQFTAGYWSKCIHPMYVSSIYGRKHEVLTICERKTILKLHSFVVRSEDIDHDLASCSVHLWQWVYSFKISWLRHSGALQIKLLLKIFCIWIYSLSCCTFLWRLKALNGLK